jgi:hypothetical protein
MRDREFWKGRSLYEYDPSIPAHKDALERKLNRHYAELVNLAIKLGMPKAGLALQLLHISMENAIDEQSEATDTARPATH